MCTLVVRNAKLDRAEWTTNAPSFESYQCSREDVVVVAIVAIHLLIQGRGQDWTVNDDESQFDALRF